jgi:hypothetical protein
MLKDMRQQFEQLLSGIGFIPKGGGGGGTSHQGSWNSNATNVPVLKAVLCAGLYGNVAVMDPSSGPPPPRVKTCPATHSFLMPFTQQLDAFHTAKPKEVRSGVHFFDVSR